MTRKRPPDPLLRELALTLKPLLGPASEKAKMLLDHLSAPQQGGLSVTPKGLADAVRRLRAAKLSDAQIRDGAKSLMAQLAERHGRERVV